MKLLRAEQEKQARSDLRSSRGAASAFGRFAQPAKHASASVLQAALPAGRSPAISNLPWQSIHAKLCSSLITAILATVPLVLGTSCGSESNSAPEDVPLNLDFSLPDLHADQTHPDILVDVADGDMTSDDSLQPSDLLADHLDDVPVPLCTPGQRRCQNLLSPAECDETGTVWLPLNPCSEGYSCYEETGSCGKTVCAPGSRDCLDAKTPQQCKFDGSSWEVGEPCGELDFCSGGFCIAPGCLPKVVFLVDRSTSMETNWDSVRNSIRGVVEQNPGIEFGLVVFPSDDGFFAGCTMDPDVPPVPLQDNAGPLIDAWFEENGPAGATPLLTAMEWVSENVSLLFGSDTANAYVVLLSDGEDKCTCSQYESNAQQRAECVAADLGPVTQTIAQQGVGVFVIGYAYSGPDIELTAIAQNGGTSQTSWISVGSEETLTQAFGELIDDLKQCM